MLKEKLNAVSDPLHILSPHHLGLPQTVSDSKAAAVCSSTPDTHRTVLLVEDDPVLRDVNHDLLENAGFDVDSAADGELGWQALRTKRYDLLVTDYDLPQLNGLQLVVRLRAQGLQLPVILASGSSELGAISDYPELRLAAILKKPIPFEVLIDTARTAVLVA